ncbi:MAG: carbohydrate kinase [Ginsengibacter sp.]
MSESKDNFPVVCFGETLWDFLPGGKLPGGAPVNVACHLQKLGKNPAVISRIGKDDLGEELKNIFELKKIHTGFFQTDNENPTGKVLAKIMDNHEVSYEILQPVAWDFIEWDSKMGNLVSSADFFVFGSLVTRNSDSKNTLFQCLEIANKKVLDINLRPPHYTREIVEELLAKADILKLNLAELHLISGWFKIFVNDEDRIKWLKEKFSIDTIIVTKGGEGAVLFMNDKFYYHRGYKVEVADTVGSGDAFLAAFISKLIENAQPAEALDFASGLGAFVASRSGACPDYELKEVYDIMSRK